MQKRTWKIDVPGPEGYSFAVRCNETQEGHAIDAALTADLFRDPIDARYASAEDITGDPDELSAFKDSTTDID